MLDHQRELMVDGIWVWLTPEGVTRELGGRADNGFRPYTSLIKAAFMGGIYWLILRSIGDIVPSFSPSFLHLAPTPNVLRLR